MIPRLANFLLAVRGREGCVLLFSISILLVTFPETGTPHNIIYYHLRRSFDRH